jgi:hypothetical protein
LFDILTLLPPIVGSFCGVLAGFFVNWKHEKNKEGRIKEEYRKAISREIEQSIGLLENGKVQLVPTSIWRSALSSGYLALFSDQEREDWRQAYFSMSKYNYGAKISRDRAEQLRATIDVKQALEAAHRDALKMGTSTLTYLQSLTERDWFRKQV